MKIIRSIVFTLGFIAILFTITPLFAPYEIDQFAKGNSTAFNGIFAEDTNRLDMLFSGDSESFTSFMPMRFWEKLGIKSYNIAVASQNLADGHKTISHIIQKQNPKVIVLETNQIYTSIGGIANLVDKSMTNTLANVFPILNHHDNWKQILSLQKAKSVEIKRNPLKGWRINRKENAYERGPYMHQTLESKEIPSLNRHYLDQIVALCKEENIQLILVSVPSPRNWTYEKHNGVSAYANENNIPFLDLNLEADSIGMNWQEDTYDKGDHLNLKGAEKVTKRLIEYIAQNYNIKSDTDEAERALWQKDFDAFIQQINP
ncbi:MULTISPECIES: SGNH/GDSL hydrolase family protein [unclassified Erysipelothrix]|uniref:SGNH/GDSL hydrolase family protein n=1 Tax=unclassified Erysipelothrix TaxID=2624170 RepID=UPI0013780F01|nr:MULTISPECIES: SGNH/GDSL hydrolase family protein [unclassified Erysipelothrix]MBK2402550.1 SGNH/GDSL hydrolase family protein [Erysipelothrix sp. strain 2 (EsS2-6-Brazil)]MBK2403466.1 SGNH/GDSL hydrolase family protein [Erysipelothrix sp. strain 2 (EsS2-7-Brazil)]NBA01512.1 SGNH/GDSL hydrolase family protein [Erysipelothrix rhusiopathiae]